jgi:hypothetical protein
LIGVLFTDELIEAGLDLPQRRVERAFATVTGTKIKNFAGGRVVPRCWAIECGESQTPQAAWHQGSTGALAETDEEIASAKINVAVWLAGRAQSGILRKSTV